MKRIYTERDRALAVEIMDDAHCGQMRKDGSEYREHPMRVMQSLEMRGYSMATLILALFHDVPEDCERWPIERIKAETGFGMDIMEPLDRLTKEHGKGDEYYENVYIPRIAKHPRSRAVKRYDLLDNMDLGNIEKPTDEQIARINKYGRSLTYLSRISQPRV
jgi:guanosine-3',5'-bis(diphosphate) 3'-pyrophosphohydrolase